MGEKDGQNKKEHEWRKRIRGPISLYAEGVLRHLFPEDADRSGTLRVHNWDRLYRFLALGPSDYITEIRALKELVADEKALQEALSTDDKSALSILRGMELYCTELEVADLSRLVESLSALAAARLTRAGRDWSDVAKQYSDVLEALIRREPASNRSHRLARVIDIAPVSISQGVLTKAAAELGQFGSGREEFEGHRLIEDLVTYKQLVGKFVERISLMFQEGADFRSEPVIYAALYRLGQLGGDYGLAREISRKLALEGDLRRLMRSTQLSGDFDVTYGHLDIVFDGTEFLELIQRDPKNHERYKKAINLLKSAEAKDYFKRRTTKPTSVWPPVGEEPSKIMVSAENSPDKP